MGNKMQQTIDRLKLRLKRIIYEQEYYLINIDNLNMMSDICEYYMKDIKQKIDKFQKENDFLFYCKHGWFPNA